MGNQVHEWPIGRWHRCSSKGQSTKAGTKEMAEKKEDGRDISKLIMR